MFEQYWFLISTALVLVISVYVLVKRSKSKLPSGPFNPLGRMFGSNSAESEEKVLQLKKYGDICCINVLGTPCIYLNTHARIRQFFVSHGDVMSGRMDMRGIKHPYLEGRGLALNEGLSWTEHRRFAMSTLRDFGFGSGGTEQIIQAELKHLVEALEANKGKPFEPRVTLNSATCNVISMLVFGERSANDESFSKLLKMLLKFSGASNQMHDCVVQVTLGILSRMPRFFLADIFDYFDTILDFMQAKVEDRKKRFNGEVHDLLDAYLKAQQDQSSNSSNAYSTFNNKELYSTITDIFVAGMETTASTLRWGIMLLIRNPEVQKRARLEIDQVLQGRVPTVADRKDLPFTDAVISEIQRFTTLTPLGVHHRCMETVKIDQYVIPENTVIFPNIFAAHRDETIWPDPFNFNPLNFYDESKKATKNNEFLIPFNVGRRNCLGESLAKQELFIFLVGLIQKFEFSAENLATFPTPNDCLFGNFRSLPLFEVIAKAL